jgi:hypothetical protein
MPLSRGGASGETAQHQNPPDLGKLRLPRSGDFQRYTLLPES